MAFWLLYLILPSFVDSIRIQQTGRNSRKSTTPPPPVVGLPPANCRALQSATQRGLSIRPTACGHGLGTFAMTAIKAGTILGDYEGESMTQKQVDARFWGKTTAKGMWGGGEGDDDDEGAQNDAWRESRLARGVGITADYLFEVEPRSFICGEDWDASNWCRFMNHAATSDAANNVRVHYDSEQQQQCIKDGEVGGSSGSLRLYFTARCDVAAGEELRYSYGNDYWEGGGESTQSSALLQEEGADDE